MTKILVITDNGILFKKFSKLLNEDFPNYISFFEFRKSYCSKFIKRYEGGIEDLKEISVKKDLNEIITNYSLVISLHCKQIFPKGLIEKVRCINVHPGYNPVNRGWYPQVFAILNHTIIGATIHEMDEFIDHGKIICRQVVPIYPTDTSKEVYERVLDIEIDLLKNNLMAIINREYSLIIPEEQGFFYTKEDFEKLCKLDLNEKLTLGEAINKLRALTHGEYSNAYFVNEGKEKIWVKLSLSKE